MANPQPGGPLAPFVVIALWLANGGSLHSAPAALAHAYAESSLEAGVTSPNPDGGTNVGLWQLDTKGVGAGHTVAELQNPNTNARLTVQGSHDGADWGPWPDDWPKFIGQSTSDVQNFTSQGHQHPGGWDSWIKHVLGTLGKDVGKVGRGVGNVFTWPGEITGFFSEAERFVQAVMWITNPENWVRILAGVAGAILGVLGLFALAKAA